MRISLRTRGSSTSARKRCDSRALRLDTKILVAAYLQHEHLWSAPDARASDLCREC